MVEIKYKLTDENMRTYGDCQWKLGEAKETVGRGKLCSPGWLHCYDSPELAVLLNPIHANFEKPRLFRCECSGECKADHGIKRGYTKLTLVQELPLPKFTTIQRVYFAIQCARKVCDTTDFVQWSEAWLTGADRSYAAARELAYEATRAAAHAAYAARAADYAAAHAAAYAAADAAAYAAYAAADAATCAEIDLITLAEEAAKAE